MFRKSALIARKSIHRLKEILRIWLGRIHIYSVSFPLYQRTFSLNLDIVAELVSLSLLPPEPEVKSESITTEARGLEFAFQAELYEVISEAQFDIDVFDILIDESSVAVSGVRSLAAEVPVFTVDTGLRVPKHASNVDIVKYDVAARPALRPIDTAVRDGLPLLERLPITRPPLTFHHMSTEERVGYWKELVQQTGQRPKDLEMIGVFPGVPRRGIKRASVNPESHALILWCKGLNQKTPMGTLIIAKNRSTGEVLRVFDRRSF